VTARPTVVLLHGLARTHFSVASLRRHIERAGFRTWARTYPSRKMGLAELAADTAARIRDDVGDGELAAVTHSLGGILVRHMAPLLPWQKVVMLAPPNRGSKVAQAFADHPFYRWFYGPVGGELASPEGWPAPPSPFGVIAGTRGLPNPTNPVTWLTRRVLDEKEPSDGTVTVEETRLEGMADFATVDASHTWILRHPRVREWVVSFLETGSFGVHVLS
jgi:pimeloyl-ACP methyl ester carboxylesterase